MTRPRFLLLFILVSAQQSIYAAAVEITLASKITITADYRPGLPNKPAVMLVHGFLQTRDFPTIQRLAQGLAEEGYTVLAPTLSLGVPKRRQSLPCEAIHNHSFDGDVAEVATWVDWLRQRGHSAIILVGHSFGSLQTLSYAARDTNPGVRSVISLSLVDTEGPADNARKRAVRDAKARLKSGNNELFAPEFAFCKTFPTTPKNFISYAQWDRKTILSLLNQVKISNHIVIGGKDTRMGPDWPNKLRAQGASISVIEGANHFFDDQHEFDLLETVLSRLQ